MTHSFSTQPCFALTAWLLLGLLTNSCEKQDPLPGPTQSGQNTFGCLIDGQTYIPDGGPPWSGIKPLSGGFLVIVPPQLGVFVRAYAKDKRQINLYLDNYALGRHLLANNTGTNPAVIYPKEYGLYIDPTGDEYVTSSSNTGWVELTKADTATGVVAGMFEFRAATRSGQVVTVTRGRFDTNYRTQ